MDDLFRFGLTNAAWATALAAAVAAGTWFMRRRPAVVHVLWLLVLIKLVTPSVTRVGFPVNAVVGQIVQNGLAAVSVSAGWGGSVRATPGDEAARTEPRPPDHKRRPPKSGASLLASPAQMPAQPEPHTPIDRSAAEMGRGPRTEVASRGWPWRPTALLLWVAGAIAWWVIAGLGSFQFRRLVRSARPAPAELTDRACRMASRLGTRSVPTIGLVPARIPPMLWAPLIGPPCLLLPEELWAQFDALQRDAVLAHELAHLKRRDHWVRRLEAIVLGLYWWYPVAWWARRQLERAEEECCDAWVVWALPSAAGRYAEALVATASFLSGLRQPLPWGASGAGSTLPIKRRLEMILRDETAGRITRAAPRVVLVLGALALPMLPALASGEQNGGLGQAAPARLEPQREAAKPTPPAKTDGQPAQEGVAFKEIALHPTKPDKKVRICRPVVREVRDYIDAVGNLQAAHTVQLRGRVSGTIVNVRCRVGQTVKVGDPLFQIDARSYQMEAKKARAEVERAEARAKRFKLQLAITKKLSDSRAVSKQEVQLAEGELDEAAASVRAAMADLDLAHLREESTQVRAPIAGTVSGPILDAGSVVAADTTLLATIVATDPVYVVFGLAEGGALRLRSEAKNQTNGSPAPIVKIGLSGQQSFTRTADVDPGDFRVSSESGQIFFRAALSNHDGILLPGLSARVRLFTGPPHKALLVPRDAFPEGWPNELRLVKEKNTVEDRKVSVGLFHDDLVDVTAGLSPQDWVVVGPWPPPHGGMQ